MVSKSRQAFKNSPDDDAIYFAKCKYLAGGTSLKNYVATAALLSIEVGRLVDLWCVVTCNVVRR